MDPTKIDLLACLPQVVRILHAKPTFGSEPKGLRAAKCHLR